MQLDEGPEEVGAISEGYFWLACARLNWRGRGGLTLNVKLDRSNSSRKEAGSKPSILILRKLGAPPAAPHKDTYS
jgi:hypothetical protein